MTATGAGPGSGAFKLTLPDLPYSYRIEDTGFYALRLDGADVAHVMFSRGARFQSLAMQAAVDALNAAQATCVEPEGTHQ